MSRFNSDAVDRLAVAIDLVNARDDGEVPGTDARRPEEIFKAHGYRAPSERGDWEELAALAERVSALLRVVADGEEDAAVAEVNWWLQEHQATPFVERKDQRWVLHFHTEEASFTAGWAGGIAAAIALSYSAGEAPRIGCCEAVGCSHLFLDRGRNRKRRFCSLRCQNRVKSATYRRRQVR